MSFRIGDAVDDDERGKGVTLLVESSCGKCFSSFFSLTLLREAGPAQKIEGRMKVSCLIRLGWYCTYHNTTSAAVQTFNIREPLP